MVCYLDGVVMVLKKMMVVMRDETGFMDPSGKCAIGGTVLSISKGLDA